jgi:thymidylate synthase ThyX
MINAKILLDSVNPTGNRITSWILTYPRFFHSEVMTHRAFSRNAASSRAIPVKRMIDDIRQNCAMPIFWGKNQAGMQAKEELDDIVKRREIVVSPVGNGLDPYKLTVTDKHAAKHEWLAARDSAIKHAEKMLELGVHKQIANRILEPFMHMTVIITGTEFENFYALRAHPDAQPEFQDLGYKMLDIYQLSEPKKLKAGEWHIPFGDNVNDQRLVDCDAFAKETEGMALGLGGGYKDYISLFKIKIATARCARVSYLNFEGKDDYNKDIELHDILAKSGHWSPFEHSAMALSTSEYSGNFKGWKQYRKTFNEENRGDGRVQKFNQ